MQHSGTAFTSRFSCLILFLKYRVIGIILFPSFLFSVELLFPSGFPPLLLPSRDIDDEQVNVNASHIYQYYLTAILHALSYVFCEHEQIILI